MDFTAPLDQARKTERLATAAREVLEAAATAAAKLPALQLDIDHALANLGDLTSQREALQKDVRALNDDAADARAGLAELRDEIARTMAKGEAEHRAKLADLDAEYQTKAADAEQKHEAAMAALFDQREAFKRDLAEKKAALESQITALTTARDKIQSELDALRKRIG